MKKWQLQEAKAKFSEVVREASRDGPQEITRHGEPAVVILSKQLYEKMLTPKINFVDLINRSPLKGVKLELERGQSLNRDVDL